MITSHHVSLAALAAALVFAAPVGAQEVAAAQEAGPAAPDPAAVAGADAIIVTGTRRVDRTVAESTAPIDVFTPADVIRQGTADTNAILQTLVPSFTVSRFAIADGSTFVRPPNLRGLPPDETLVLVNSKRRHRSALVQLGGGALAEGSQAVDLNQIPAIAIGRLEVLRDGASAQYGSDAIAGVINVVLRDNAEGFDGYVKYGQYYEGDGEDIQVAANAGLPLGDTGFFSISGEYVDSDYTHRGGTRPSAQALQNAFPDIEVNNPAQLQGNPKVEAVRVFANAGFDLGTSEVYAFGNYGHSEQIGSFNYRQSRTVPNPDFGTIGGPTFNAIGIFRDIYLDRLPNGNYDAEGRTFNFLSVYPGGFTPFFLGTIDDISLTGGYRGELEMGLTYDFSASYGQDTLEYGLIETLNASMGPESPFEVSPGSLEQRETNFNADFSYPFELGLATPLVVAFGGEMRREAYEIGLGDEASYAIGPYAVQVVERDDGTTFNASQPVGSNGFPGYGPDIAGSSSRKSYAAYLDVEGDLFDGFTLGGAGRFEHFTDFGDTWTYKVSGRYEFIPEIAVRGTLSTGFRAPTPGQVNTSSIATTFEAGNPNPIELATLPVTEPAAQFYGAELLSPEKSDNYTIGLVLQPLPRASITIDYYHIKVKERIGTSQAFDVSDADRPALQAIGVGNYATLGQVQYLTNAFDTRTRGLDIVANYLLPTSSAGTFNTTLAMNWGDTDVTERDPVVIDDERVFNIENILPTFHLIATEVWTYDPISILLRANHYSSYAGSSGNIEQRFGSEFTLDLEVSYTVSETFTLSAGGLNIFDKYPDRDARGGIYPATDSLFNGARYPDFSPIGFNGGFWYVRAGVSF